RTLKINVCDILLTPSLTCRVMAALPNWFDAGVILRIRLAPLPSKTRPSCGTSAGFDEDAVTVNELAGVEPSSPTVKGTVMTWSGDAVISDNPEIGSARKLSAISNRSGPWNVRSGATCSTVLSEFMTNW